MNETGLPLSVRLIFAQVCAIFIGVFIGTYGASLMQSMGGIQLDEGDNITSLPGVKLNYNDPNVRNGLVYEISYFDASVLG